MASIQSDSQKDFSKHLLDGLRPLSLGKLVSNPLVSCVKAQYKSIEATYDAILSQSFIKSHDEQKKGNEVVEPIFISFSYTHKGRIYRLKVPLFTLVPISYLEIQQVDLSFVADITVNSKDGIKGVFSQKQKNESLNRSFNGQCTIDYKINMGICDMTAGLASIFQLCQENVVVNPKDNTNPAGNNDSSNKGTIGSDLSSGSLRQTSQSGGNLSISGILRSIDKPRYTGTRSSSRRTYTSSSGGAISTSGILHSINTSRYFGSSSKRVGSSGGVISTSGILHSINTQRYVGSQSKQISSSRSLSYFHGILRSINRRRRPLEKYGKYRLGDVSNALKKKGKGKKGRKK